MSKGVVVCSEHIELNFEEIKAMADNLMYADKDEYYRRTGKDRRRVWFINWYLIYVKNPTTLNLCMSYYV